MERSFRWSVYLVLVEIPVLKADGDGRAIRWRTFLTAPPPLFCRWLIWNQRSRRPGTPHARARQPNHGMVHCQWLDSPRKDGNSAGSGLPCGHLLSVHLNTRSFTIKTCAAKWTGSAISNAWLDVLWLGEGDPSRWCWVVRKGNGVLSVNTNQTKSKWRMAVVSGPYTWAISGSEPGRGPSLFRKGEQAVGGLATASASGVMGKKKRKSLGKGKGRRPLLNNTGYDIATSSFSHISYELLDHGLLAYSSTRNFNSLICDCSRPLTCL